MKTIALFGASGKTGQHVLQKALSKGYMVKALARNPSSISLQHNNLVVIKGDILQVSDVEQTLKDADSVISVFGHVKNSPEWLQTQGTKNIVAGMKKNGLNKIVSLSGGGLPFPEKDQPKFADKMIRTIMKLAVPKILNDAIAHHQVLKESGLNWIIVRGPRLTDGKEIGSYRVGWVGVNASTSIARADLADFIVKQIDDEQFVWTMPFVSY